MIALHMTAFFGDNSFKKSKSKNTRLKIKNFLSGVRKDSKRKKK